MPDKLQLNEERARQAMQAAVDERASAARARFGGRDERLHETAATRSAQKDGEHLRKMAPPSRRYWPTPNSQRAPSRPQAKKGSSK
jgi:hypothetical protein